MVTFVRAATTTIQSTMITTSTSSNVNNNDHNFDCRWNITIQIECHLKNEISFWSTSDFNIPFSHEGQKRQQQNLDIISSTSSTPTHFSSSPSKFTPPPPDDLFSCPHPFLDSGQTSLCNQF